jgi:hypothetical protein
MVSIFLVLAEVYRFGGLPSESFKWGCRVMLSTVTGPFTAFRNHLLFM